MNEQTNWPHFIAMQAGTVPYSEDDPGWAKTAAHKAFAKKVGRKLIQIILSQKLREDIGGVPVPSKVIIDGEEIECVKPLLMEDMVYANNDKCIIVFDEFNQAPKDVMGSAQEWINEPPPNSWMAALGNPPERSTCGQELSAPVSNRMCMLKWERFNEERRQGWKNGFKDYPAPDMPVVPENFLEDFGPKYGELMCQFEELFPDHFGEYTFPTEDDKDQMNNSGAEPGSRPWRSGRSWSNAGKLLAACESVGGTQTTAFKLVAGCVGMGPASEFIAWLDKQDLPSARELLADPHKLKLPTRFDLSRAVVNSVLGCAAADKTPETWEDAYSVMIEVFQQNREVALACMGKLVNYLPEGHVPQIRDGVATEMNQILVNKHQLALS